MEIAVVGSGYVGLVAGACFAETGNDVICVDIDEKKVARLKKGEVPIYEPGLEDLLKRNHKEGRLTFTTELDAAVKASKIIFIAVGTPQDEDGSADLKYVLDAAKNIGRYMSDYKVVVDKSTVPVGTADKVSATIAQALKERGVDVPFSVISNPEFLKEGAAIEDFMRPDRIVIGADDEQALHLMRGLYAPFQRNHERLVTMDVRSAELTKYAANAMLATRISFMNELANLAELLGADIESVRKGIGSDPRIGYDFLYAGCGYGGSCFPKDVKALITSAQAKDYDLKVLNAVELANDAQKQVLLRKIKRHFKDNLQGKHFALWGLAFKPNTDDMREAPSRIVIEHLLAAGATVSAYDPVAIHEAKRIFKDVAGLTFGENQNTVLKNADALVIVTEWKEFKSPDFSYIKQQLKSSVVFDGRNLYAPKLVAAHGIDYYPIGR
jgi:UDPglucose 6-dehydrogenase